VTDVADGAGSHLLVDVRAGDRRTERHVTQSHVAVECSRCAPAVAHAASDWTDVVADVAAPNLAKTLTGRLGVVIANIANPAVPARRSALQPATARTLRGGRQQRALPCRACAAYLAAAYASQALHGGARCCHPPHRVRAVPGWQWAHRAGSARWPPGGEYAVHARRGAWIKTVRHADAARRKPKIYFTLLGCERHARSGDADGGMAMEI
jgi:hypothetical protein